MLAEGVVFGTLAAALALGGGRAEGDRRRYLWGLAAVAGPLGAALWANATAVPALASGPHPVSLDGGALWGKLHLLFGAGLVPGLVAWSLIRRTSRGETLSRGGGDGAPRAVRVARGAGLALLTVAAAGGSVAFLAAFGADGPPVDGLWAGASPVLVLGLSLVAAGAEELLFRGTLLPAFAGRLGWRGSGALQAGLFGLLHAGYGDPVYVVAAAAFGLVQASVARWWGLGVAVLVHAQVNLVILGWAARAVSPLNPAMALAVVAVDLVLVALAVDGPLVPTGDGGAAAGS